ncbi:type I restriction-modification system subunit M [Patescibacteria group bacterium]|nr:type I restriction-modification system subunit M [Patescibacteria group bacterium]MBU1672861.1 type I restriction-modification system subunit M [Patescibacteria group bacterium]MBU1901586.1 type I restriction-modification system subunit M [Patescibacteria group bacterium]
MSDIVQKLWSLAGNLHDEGMHYGDYIEQLTYLLFLKMADEKGIRIPSEYSWQTLMNHSGMALIEHYEVVLKNLGKEAGVLGDIFAQSNNKFRNPVSLNKVIGALDDEEWSSIDIDVKGAAYEGLLAKYAAEQKGAGQYFTPRELIRTIVKCINPKHNETIHDPACGTGGFLIEAFEYIFKELEKEKKSLKREEYDFLQKEAISGGEFVWETRRLCIMNLYLHEIEGQITYGDSLKEKYGDGYDVILTNPPFKKTNSVSYSRDDFFVVTKSRQLNFLQHCMSILKNGGRCAMVMPDNVLFEGGAGTKIRKMLLENFNLHTIIRLPNGTFTPYTPGVKTNVIFFEKTGEKTENLWFYDLRTNVEKISKRKPLKSEYFNDFLEKYQNRDQETERWKKFLFEDLKKRNFNLDLKWLKDESFDDPSNLPEPNVLIEESVNFLKEAIDKLEDLQKELG